MQIFIALVEQCPGAECRDQDAHGGQHEHPEWLPAFVQLLEVHAEHRRGQTERDEDKGQNGDWDRGSISLAHS